MSKFLKRAFPAVRAAMAVAILAWAVSSTAMAVPLDDGSAAYDRGDYTTQPALAGSFDDAAAAMQRNDYQAAAQILRPLAEQGLADAQTMLGAMYNTGQGVALDHAEAVKWFRAAARQGDAGGQDSLGLAYEEGAGVSRDYLRAYMWYWLAATSGDAYADAFAQDRDKIAARMNKAQVAEAMGLAVKCRASNFKDCE
jgi:TPR repeat protein